LDGETIGTVGYAPGRLGQSWRFDGKGFVRVFRTGQLGIARDFTIAFWIAFDPDAHHAMTIVSRMTIGSVQDGFRVERLKDGRMAACLGGGARDGCAPDAQGTRVMSAAAIGEGWHHVAVVRAGDTLTLHVDARAGVPTPLVNALNHEPGELRFGVDERGRAPFVGRLDEIEFYNRALDPSEISARVSAISDK